jgi:hypothetical protein
VLVRRSASAICYPTPLLPVNGSRILRATAVDNESPHGDLPLSSKDRVEDIETNNLTLEYPGHAKNRTQQTVHAAGLETQMEIPFSRNDVQALLGTLLYKKFSLMNDLMSSLSLYLPLPASLSWRPWRRLPSSGAVDLFCAHATTLNTLEGLESEHNHRSCNVLSVERPMRTRYCCSTSAGADLPRMCGGQRWCLSPRGCQYYRPR